MAECDMRTKRTPNRECLKASSDPSYLSDFRPSLSGGSIHTSPSDCTYPNHSLSILLDGSSAVENPILSAARLSVCWFVIETHMSSYTQTQNPDAHTHSRTHHLRLKCAPLKHPTLDVCVPIWCEHNVKNREHHRCLYAICLVIRLERACVYHSLTLWIYHNHTHIHIHIRTHQMH